MAVVIAPPFLGMGVGVHTINDRLQAEGANFTRIPPPPQRSTIYANDGKTVLARVYLDNFPSVQASWVTQGPQIGQIALRYGANDLGSIMIEENVVAQAGASFRMTVQDMRRLIQELGYEPRQRDNWYQLVDAA